ncbi:uncharacterized protein LOC113955856 [Corapipo altera]|uniref:uncharacterized protein LOC113955856 n=1 Tax=Corapipo altera TaxID=415028 RepID=UPI000FD6731F|nr:uncharacterized protein LOC113955856 [Corapipo altera]
MLEMEKKQLIWLPGSAGSSPGGRRAGGGPALGCAGALWGRSGHRAGQPRDAGQGWGLCWPSPLRGCPLSAPVQSNRVPARLAGAPQGEEPGPEEAQRCCDPRSVSPAFGTVPTAPLARSIQLKDPGVCTSSFAGEPACLDTSCLTKRHCGKICPESSWPVSAHWGVFKAVPSAVVWYSPFSVAQGPVLAAGPTPRSVLLASILPASLLLGSHLPVSASSAHLGSSLLTTCFSLAVLP